MIERFRVQNYKALKDVELALTPIHVLIGPNDSGKTSILEALAALSRSVEMPLAASFRGRWDGRDLVWMGDDSPIKLEASGKHVTYELTCRFPKDGRVVVAHGESLDGQKAAISGQQSLVSAGFHNPAEVNSSYLQSIKAVHDLLWGVHLYRWVPRLLSLPCALDATRKYAMDVTGFGLALCLDELLGSDRTLFTEMENRFRKIFPQVLSIKLLQASAYRATADLTLGFPILQNADGKGIYFEMSTSRTLVPAAQVSDGLLLVLAYLTVLYLPEPPRLLLVEEPENGIHPGRLREVMTILRELVAEQGEE